MPKVFCAMSFAAMLAGAGPIAPSAWFSLPIVPVASPLQYVVPWGRKPARESAHRPSPPLS